MNHTLRVGGIQRFGDLHREGEGAIDRKGTALQALRERLPLEKLHDQVGDAVLLTYVVERADVGMTQAGERSCFTVEPLQLRRLNATRRGQHLDGDRAPQAEVAGVIDLTHSSGTEAGQDLVGSDSRARG